MMSTYRRDLANVKVLTREEAVALHNRTQQGDEHARHLLIESILQYVFLAAKPFIHRAQQQGVSPDDVISEANVAAIAAVDSWDPSRGALTTVAKRCIYNHLQLCMYRYWHRGIYVPKYTLEQLDCVNHHHIKKKRRLELIGATAALGIISLSEEEYNDDEL